MLMVVPSCDLSQWGKDKEQEEPSSSLLSRNFSTWLLPSQGVNTTHLRYTAVFTGLKDLLPYFIRLLGVWYLEQNGSKVIEPTTECNRGDGINSRIMAESVTIITCPLWARHGSTWCQRYKLTSALFLQTLYSNKKNGHVRFLQGLQ